MSRTQTLQLLMLSISVSALAACGSSAGNGTAKTAAPMPPIAEMDAAMNDTAPPPAPLPLSQSDTLTPAMPAATAPAAIAPNASIETRMEKLEQSVNSLRSDYNRIMPAFASLNTTNERIQVLLDEIEGENKLTPAKTSVSTIAPAKLPATPPVTTTTATTTTITTPGAVSTPPDETPVETKVTETTVTETKPLVTETTETTSAAIAGTVTAVRIGEHGTKTRIVFDLTTKTKPDFKYDLDNAEKVLLVDMPASTWTAAEGGKPNSPMIAGWTSSKGAGGGSNIAIQLKKDARILSTEYLKAEGKDPARLVLDIAPAN